MLFVVDVVLLLDVHDKQYVWMSCHCQTIVLSFMHQRPEMRSKKQARVDHWPVCLPTLVLAHAPARARDTVGGTFKMASL